MSYFPDPYKNRDKERIFLDKETNIKIKYKQSGRRESLGNNKIIDFAVLSLKA